MMRDHFIKMGLETPVIDTRIAIQRSAFTWQAKQEILVHQAYTSLVDSQSKNKSVLIGHDESVTPTGSLWTLSSTEFWHMNKVGKNWEQYKWAPGGYLRIYALDGNSHLHLDFGDCSFTTGPVIIPLLASPSPQTVSASSDALGSDFEFGISFLGNSCLKVRFPVWFLSSSDGGYDTSSTEKSHVEFCGVFDGFFLGGYQDAWKLWIRECLH